MTLFFNPTFSSSLMLFPMILFSCLKKAAFERINDMLQNFRKCLKQYSNKTINTKFEFVLRVRPNLIGFACIVWLLLPKV